MSAINPIKRNDAGFHDTSRQTATRSNNRGNAEGGLNFADVLAGVTGNDSHPITKNDYNTFRGAVGLPVSQSGIGVLPEMANAAYIRAGAKSHALGERHKASVGPAIYDLNG